MKIEGYEIIKKLFTLEHGLTVYEVKQTGDNKPFIMRLADYSNNKHGFSQDQWYELYEQYQLTITNYKNLPRVSTISMVNENQVYSLLDYEEGRPLKELGKLEPDAISQLLAAVRHLHSKKFVHGAIYPENIWLTNQGKVILYGAGELKALGIGQDQRYSADIKQLTEIITSFSPLSEEDLERLINENAATIDEVEAIIATAAYAEQTENNKKKGGLAEKEEQKGTEKTAPPPAAVTEEKQPHETVILEMETEQQADNSGHPNTDSEQRSDQRADESRENRAEETREERQRRGESGKFSAWIKNIAIGAAAVLALLFIIDKFTADEPEVTSAPAAKTSAADVSVNEKAEQPEETADEQKETSTAESLSQPSVDKQPLEEMVSYTREEVAQFMQEYTAASVRAINNRDFSAVEPLLDPNGENYKVQLDYIDYLEKKGITEELIDIRLSDFLKVDQSTYKVSTAEAYEIAYSDGSIKAKSFNSSYILKVKDGRLTVNKLLYTKAASSEVIQEGYADSSDDTVYLNDVTAYPNSSGTYSEEPLDDSGAIESAVRLHYGSISNDDFNTAFNQFSAARKKKMSKDAWLKGLQENMYDELTYVSVEQAGSNRGRAYIEMTSYDDNQDGTTLVQQWAGYWELIKENGRWTLHNPKLKKVGSRVETR